MLSAVCSQLMAFYQTAFSACVANSKNVNWVGFCINTQDKGSSVVIFLYDEKLYQDNMMTQGLLYPTLKYTCISSNMTADIIEMNGNILFHQQRTRIGHMNLYQLYMQPNGPPFQVNLSLMVQYGVVISKPTFMVGTLTSQFEKIFTRMTS